MAAVSRNVFEMEKSEENIDRIEQLKQDFKELEQITDNPKLVKIEKYKKLIEKYKKQDYIIILDTNKELKKDFYSNGKLLLTSEYVVLDGAIALAIPTRLGQS